jgi:hypothetical protein
MDVQATGSYFKVALLSDILESVKEIMKDLIQNLDPKSNPGLCRCGPVMVTTHMRSLNPRYYPVI